MKNRSKPDPDADLKQLIQSIYDEHKGRYGYRRIRYELCNLGHKVNHKKSTKNHESPWFKIVSSYEKISSLS